MTPNSPMAGSPVVVLNTAKAMALHAPPHSSAGHHMVHLVAVAPGVFVPATAPRQHSWFNINSHTIYHSLSQQRQGAWLSCFSYFPCVCVKVILEHSTLLLRPAPCTPLLSAERGQVAKQSRFVGIQKLMVTMDNRNRRGFKL